MQERRRVAYTPLTSMRPEGRRILEREHPNCLLKWLDRPSRKRVLQAKYWMIVSSHIPNVYCFLVEPNPAEAALQVMEELKIDPLWTVWEPQGDFWIVFRHLADAVLFRLTFCERRMEVCESDDPDFDIMIRAPYDLLEGLPGWIEENGLRDRLGWFELVRIHFHEPESRKKFEAALETFDED